MESAGDRPWHLALAGALLLAGPLARNLYYERYPLGNLEALVLIGGLALVGAAAAVLSARSNRYVADVVFALLLLVYLDLDFDPERFLPIELVGLGCLFAAILFRQRRATIACVVLVAFDLASLPSRTPEERASRVASAPRPTSLTPIIHVVLDEHLGVGGFRAAGDTATADLLTDFFHRRGFDLYPAAYSRFFFTQNSIPAIMSLGTVSDSTMLVRVGRPPYRLTVNPYFARLARQGYELNVYQSANLQFCDTPGVPVVTCVEVSPNSVANVGYMDVGWRERAALASEFYLRYASNLAERLQGWVVPKLEKRRLFVSRGIKLLMQAGADIETRRRRSDFVFVHLLLPHSPYEVDERCRPFPRTLEPAQVPMTGLVPDSLLAIRWHRYQQQVRCTYLVLGRFLDQVDRAYGPGRSIIIIHGDHGSRGTPMNPTDGRLAGFRKQDLNAGFATLLAVKFPGARGEIHPEPVPLQDFLWGFIESGFRTLPTSRWQHYVYSTSSDGIGRSPRTLDSTEMTWAFGGTAATDFTREAVLGHRR